MTGRDPGTGQTYVPDSGPGTTTGPGTTVPMAEVRVAMRRAFGVPCEGPSATALNTLNRLLCMQPTTEWNGVECERCPRGRGQ